MTSAMNNLVILNQLRAMGVMVCKTPSGMVAYGLSKLNPSQREMFNRMTQDEIYAAWRIQKA